LPAGVVKEYKAFGSLCGSTNFMKFAENDAKDRLDGVLSFSTNEAGDDCDRKIDPVTPEKNKEICLFLNTSAEVTPNKNKNKCLAFLEPISKNIQQMG
jgi:hypothetical protein